MPRERPSHSRRKLNARATSLPTTGYLVGRYQLKSEWICFEHYGFARNKAEQWWLRRSPDPTPATAQDAVDLANAGTLATTHKITVRAVAGEPYERIIDYDLGPLPEAVTTNIATFDPDPLPF